MFQSFYKVILIFTINLIISIPIYAKAIEQNQIDFPIKTELLIKGEMHYFFSIMSAREFSVKYPEIFELDSLSLVQEAGVKLVLTKSVMIINRPVGFFDDKQMLAPDYVKHMMGDQKVQKTRTDSYKITVPGSAAHTYVMQSYFDADDVSTLPNSKIIRAVTVAKKLDVISQSASLIMFTEKTNFSKFCEGAVSVSSFVAMKENKTLVITYNLWAVKKEFADAKILKANLLNEIEDVKELNESYK